MKKGALILFLLATPLLGNASHIVGGEFELLHISGFQYNLNMILYFDEINGQPGAKDLGGVDVRIFRKFDNQRIRDIHLTLLSQIAVLYTQPECAIDQLVTTKMLYTAVVTLQPEIFNHPGGYYISWERCCRNYGISNIFSDNPAFGTRFAGQTFYLEFPPVVKDGVPFVDSTPRLFPPLSDYGSPYHPYYTDFGGVDDDGDSLVYSLVDPLNTISADAIPAGGPRPGPYPPVAWRPPYSLQRPMWGSPDLRISKDGLLTVTPGSVGLFVFAVKVEEYRDDIKIGETRRDFQMLVVDAPQAEPPVILGKQRVTDPEFNFDGQMSVFITNSATGDDRCIAVRISDPDSEAEDNQFLERVRVKAVALNFKKDLTSILPAETTATLTNGSTAEFTICFPVCPYFNGIAQIGIIALDDACALPLMDTLKVNLQIESPPNNKPRIVSPTPVNETVAEGPPTHSWPFQVVDDDNDVMDVVPVTSGFVLADAGMSFTTTPQSGGIINGTLNWDPYCDIYDFTKRTSFTVSILVEDRDMCLTQNPAKALYNLSVILEGNADPIIDTDLTPNTAERNVKITRRIHQSLNFKVTGKDLTDNDFLVLEGKGLGFNYLDHGVTITPQTASGNGVVTSDLGWNINCTSLDLNAKDSLSFRFIVVDDKNKCRFHKADTVDVTVKVIPPVNQPPLLTITNANMAATVLYNNSISMTLGPTIGLLLTGTDGDVAPDKDNLKLELVRAEGNVEPEGYSFARVEGKSPVQAEFNWQPDCSIFENDIYENEYTFTFRLSDDHCITGRADSVNIRIKVKDIEGSDADFNPPNFFSPNGDVHNEYFAMEALDPVTKEPLNILPLDNCVSRFESVRIYNRWGNQVYQSGDRNFRWYGEGESPGVYFYVINFTKKEYKGSLSLRY